MSSDSLQHQAHTIDHSIRREASDGEGYWYFAENRLNKERITVRVDRDVLAYFRKSGKGYQTRMNAALRSIMEIESKA